MGIEAIKAKFASLKNMVVNNAKADIEAYKKRKIEERLIEREAREKERKVYREAMYKERLKVAAIKGKEKARSGNIGFLSNISANLKRNQGSSGPFSNDLIKPINFNNEISSRDIITGKINKRK